MSSEVAEASAGTEPVREGSRFDVARLEQWLQHNVEDFEGPLTVEQFRGGPHSVAQGGTPGEHAARPQRAL